MTNEFVLALIAKRNAAEAHFATLDDIQDCSKQGLIFAKAALADMEKWQGAYKEVFADMLTTWNTIPNGDAKTNARQFADAALGLVDPLHWAVVAVNYYADNLEK